MTSLVVAEHDNASLKEATLNTVTAAAKMGGDVHVLVAGSNCGPAAEAASRIAGVSKVLVADAPDYEHPLAEAMAPLIVKLAADYDAVLAPATTTGKNIMPRVAALLDVSQISDIIDVVSGDTFKRPIYAGNAIATVKTSDAKKIITVRATGFEKAAAEGGSATVESISGEGNPTPPSAPAAPRWMPASCRTTIRSARPARSSHPSFTLQSAFPARFSISPA